MSKRADRLTRSVLIFLGGADGGRSTLAWARTCGRAGVLAVCMLDVLGIEGLAWAIVAYVRAWTCALQVVPGRLGGAQAPDGIPPATTGLPCCTASRATACGKEHRREEPATHLLQSTGTETAAQGIGGDDIRLCAIGVQQDCARATVRPDS
jgi:hypothetical protein